jgi:cytochrome c peroxidase
LGTGIADAKRAAIVIAAVALIFGAAGSLFGAPQAGLAALKRQYWRPAAIPYPKENPYGRAKGELGRALFFDPILSGARVRSCATCHNPGLSWSDGEPRAIGENQVRLPLRSPTRMGTSTTWKAWQWVPSGSATDIFTELQAVRSSIARTRL